MRDPRAGFALAGKALIAAALVAVAAMMALAGRSPPAQLEMARSMTVDRIAASKTDDGPCIGPVSPVIPVANANAKQLTDTFADARSEGRRHDAIDIMAPLGTPVIAAASGRLEKLFTSQAGGNAIYVRSSGGRMIYYYAHLDSYAAGLREGQAVMRGALLGTVGHSGNASATAPHLHFAMMLTDPARKWWEPSRAVNPFNYLVAKASNGKCR